jgi:phospholipid/cholesterol/gamma-HCH transport system substrate-binding protein
MRRNVLETVMGAVVLVVAGIFMVFAYSTADLGAVSGYRVTAKFDRVDGIAEGTDVRLSGIKVGTVTKQTLDPETFLAVVEMTIDPSINLPTDTAARVISDGLLGGKYMALEPGGDEKLIKPGGTIEFTQSSVSIEDLVGQLIFSNRSASGGDQKK